MVEMRDGAITFKLEDMPEGIAFLRRYLGVSQVELGRRIGISRRTLQRWEANKYERVKLHQLHEIFWGLGILDRTTAVITRDKG